MTKIQIPYKVGRIQKIMGVPCYLVGGAVIDALRNIPNVDYDIEVFGLSYNQIQTKLEDAGYKCKLTGKAFGVLQVTYDGDEFDISVPRTENKLGVGHSDFEVTLSSDMSPKEAAIRRGLTIEALMATIPDGEVLDFNGGMKDLIGGILKANNPVKFEEDALRVMRIAQNLSRRRGEVVELLTIQACKRMSPVHLSKERLYGEMSKVLMGSSPAKAFEFLDIVGWVKHWPELDALHEVYQRPDYHAEGDVWIHQMMVIDQAVHYKQFIPEELQLQVMWAALMLSASLKLQIRTAKP